MVKIEGVLSIDLGTQSIRAALYTLKGQLLSLATKGYETYYPAPGLAEQNPEDWWKAFKLAVQELVEKCPTISVVAIVASATSSTVFLQSLDESKTFALSIEVSFFPRVIAMSKATFAILRTSSEV